MDELSCSLLISYFFCNVHGSFMAGEEEDLLFFAQIHEEAEGFALPFFIEADEDIVQNDGQRFDVLSEGESHGQGKNPHH